MQIKYELDKKIYDENIINQAIFDFKDISIINYQNGFLIIEGENENEIGEIFGEFSNYIIGLYNEK